MHEDILEVILNDKMLKGIHLDQVAIKEFLDIGIIGVTSISLLTVLVPLKKSFAAPNPGFNASVAAV